MFGGTRFLSTTAACRAPKILSKKEKAGIASKGQNPQKNKKKDDGGRKKKKARTTFKTYDSKDAEMFSLCDAMRFVSSPLCASWQLVLGERQELMDRDGLGTYEPSKSGAHLHQ
jgi:hypothetical protein